MTTARVAALLVLSTLTAACPRPKPPDDEVPVTLPQAPDEPPIKSVAT